MRSELKRFGDVVLDESERSFSPKEDGRVEGDDEAIRAPRSNTRAGKILPGVVIIAPTMGFGVDAGFRGRVVVSGGITSEGVDDHNVVLFIA